MEAPDRWVRVRVALKIIKAGMDTAQVVARFEAERAGDRPDVPQPGRIREGRAAVAGGVGEPAPARPRRPRGLPPQDGVAVMRQITAPSNAGSLAMAQSAAEGLARTLGPDHPDTLASHRHLALALMSASRVAEAVALHEDTVKAKGRVHGPD